MGEAGRCPAALCGTARATLLLQALRAQAGRPGPRRRCSRGAPLTDALSAAREEPVPSPAALTCCRGSNSARRCSAGSASGPDPFPDHFSELQIHIHLGTLSPGPRRVQTCAAGFSRTVSFLPYFPHFGCPLMKLPAARQGAHGGGPSPTSPHPSPHTADHQVLSSDLPGRTAMRCALSAHRCSGPSPRDLSLGVTLQVHLTLLYGRRSVWQKDTALAFKQRSFHTGHARAQKVNKGDKRPRDQEKRKRDSQGRRDTPRRRWCPNREPRAGDGAVWGQAGAVGAQRTPGCTGDAPERR